MNFAPFARSTVYSSANNKDGDTETKKRAVELAEEEDFGTSTQAQVKVGMMNNYVVECF